MYVKFWKFESELSFILYVLTNKNKQGRRHVSCMDEFQLGEIAGGRSSTVGLTRSVSGLIN